ncbi:alpha/beta fold hydrolase [Ureibacillus acetophenoni]
MEPYGDTKKPCLLFLHGGGVGGWMWEEQIQYFKKDYFILVPELPLTDPHFSIQQTALELNEQMREFYGNHKVTLVGFSIGAQISLAMVGNSPSQYNAAMINSALAIPIQNKVMDSTLKYSYPLTRSRMFAKLQAKSMAFPKRHFNTYYEQSLEFTKEAFLNMMKENMSFQVPKTFFETKIPILFTIGSKEQKIVRQSFEILNTNTENSRSYIFENVGHNAPFIAANEFNRVLEKWLEEVL